MTLDAGALIAIERGDSRINSIVKRANQRGALITVPVVVIAQVWRHQTQVGLRMFLRGVAVDLFDEQAAKQVGVLCGRAGTTDIVDAPVVIGAAARGNAIVTSDYADLSHLAGFLRGPGPIIPLARLPIPTLTRRCYTSPSLPGARCTVNEAADPESDQAILRLASGLREATMGPPAPVAQSRRQAVAFRGKARVYHYPPKDGGRLATPLVLFPYLGISRPYIFDLRPGESFAEFLYEQGISFYLCDWGVFGPEDRDMGMDDVISDMIPALIRQVVAHSGADGITAFGYCMGVPMTVAALAADPTLPVKNLLTMVGPIDFAEGDFPRMTDDDKFDVDAIIETFDLMPPEFIRSGFKMMNPMGDAQQMQTLMEKAGDAEWLIGYKAMNRWSSEWMPLPKQFFRQWVRHFYQGNELVRGEFRVCGEKVSLADITVPLFCVAATYDDIVPPAAARALVDGVSSADKRFLELQGGHISVIAGKRARQTAWPAVAAWLKEHD